MREGRPHELAPRRCGIVERGGGDVQDTEELAALKALQTVAQTLQTLQTLYTRASLGG